MSKGFSVAHQKVSVDVDLESSKLTGWTELTVIPAVKDLRQIKLDAQEFDVTDVEVNNLPAKWTHEDFARAAPQIPSDWNVYKSAQLAENYAKQGENLIIDLPETVQITSQDTGSGSFIVSHSSQEKNYAPLTVRVYFSVSGSTSGLTFVKSGPRTDWHAYTTLSPLGQGASCWMPCVDQFKALCTWEMEFSVPKSLSDEEDDEDEDRAELVVICNNNSPSQVAHPTDPQKKIVSFDMFTPIFSHHVGFAVGAFQQIPMTSSDETAESSSGIPFCVFGLSSKVAMIRNTCGIFSKAMEYFTREFASFPFSSYSVCFVDELPFDSADAAGLTIISDKLLAPANLIEPLFDHTQPLIRCLAAQWCGVNIVPATWNDMWVTEGVAHYMTHLFIRRLMGNNEYRLRMKLFVDEITEQDVDMPPIGAPNFSLPVSQDDLQFIRLKAPLVLYILNRRMTKTDRSLGLARVIPKLFLQSMSGELNAQISTAHFQKLCEKVAHHRLDNFFNEWVHGSGYPIFRVTQRFNKKRMFIEMGIGQVQSRELPPEAFKDSEFLSRAVRDLINEKTGTVYTASPVYTGPMTIRIHEADGTPYEHVVELKDHFTKLDIQYNTKYKRLKRNQKFKNGGMDVLGGNTEDGYINCLGDNLMSDRDTMKWKLTDWGQDDEDYMFNEAFEWIRVDSDFEWICKLFVAQPDYMYASQLQQDRDVVAQYEAVTYFGTHQSPNAIYSSILTRTIMDWRYFYKVREHAALGLVNTATSHLNYLGKFHLFKVFEEMFCFENSLIPRANDFTDFGNYFVQKAIVMALSKIRTPSGECPQDVRKFLLDLIRYNENSGNAYSDCYYVSTLIKAVVNTLIPKDSDTIDHYRMQDYVVKISGEIDKCQRLDSWLPSYHHMVTTTAIRQNELLIRLGFGRPRLDKLLLGTKPEIDPLIRLAAFQVLLNLGGYKEPLVLKYVFQTALRDSSAYIRYNLTRAIGTLLGVIAKDGEYTDNSEPKDLLKARQDALAKSSVRTSIPVVAEALGKYKNLQDEIWHALKGSSLGLVERKCLLDICAVLYPASAASKKVYKLSAKRRGEDYLMVFRYRSEAKLKKFKEEPEEERKPISLKLKIGGV